MSIDETIADLKAKLAKVTPGQWWHGWDDAKGAFRECAIEKVVVHDSSRPDVGVDGLVFGFPCFDIAGRTVEKGSDEQFQAQADMEFIVAAANALPSLLGEIERLTGLANGAAYQAEGLRTRLAARDAECSELEAELAAIKAAAREYLADDWPEAEAKLRELLK
jgi:hypothetical protein